MGSLLYFSRVGRGGEVNSVGSAAEAAHGSHTQKAVDYPALSTGRFGKDFVSLEAGLSRPRLAEN